MEHADISLKKKKTTRIDDILICNGIQCFRVGTFIKIIYVGTHKNIIVRRGSQRRIKINEIIVWLRDGCTVRENGLEDDFYRSS